MPNKNKITEQFEEMMVKEYGVEFVDVESDRPQPEPACAESGHGHEMTIEELREELLKEGIDPDELIRKVRERIDPLIDRPSPPEESDKTKLIEALGGNIRPLNADDYSLRVNSPPVPQSTYVEPKCGFMGCRCVDISPATVDRPPATTEPAESEGNCDEPYCQCGHLRDQFHDGGSEGCCYAHPITGSDCNCKKYQHEATAPPAAPAIDSVEDRADQALKRYTTSYERMTRSIVLGLMTAFAQAETASLRAENEKLRGELEWIEINASSIVLFIPSGELKHIGYNAHISINRYRNEISAHVSGELPEQVATLSEAIERIKALTAQADKDEL